MQFELYVDTSVFGALVDANAARLEATERFLDAAVAERFRPVISGLVLEEVDRAPLNVRTRLEDAIRTADAIHLATAAVAGVDAVVSWNFKHMVNLARKRRVHAINLREGYRLVDIVSPFDVEYLE